MAKLNGTLNWIKTAVYLAIIVGGLGATWATLGGDVKDNTEDIASVCTKVDANIAIGHVRDIEVNGLKKDLGYLKERMAEQKIDLDNHTVLLERILVEVVK